MVEFPILDLSPWQAGCQHRQWVTQVDHGINPAAEKVVALHLGIPQKSSGGITFVEGIGLQVSA